MGQVSALAALKQVTAQVRGGRNPQGWTQVAAFFESPDNYNMQARLFSD